MTGIVSYLSVTTSMRLNTNMNKIHAVFYKLKPNSTQAHKDDLQQKGMELGKY